MTKLSIETPGDTQIVIRRFFAAPSALVFRAHTDAELIPRWMTGPPGWSMPACQSDPRPGGHMRFEWTNGETGFHATGEYLEIEHGRRILHVERMFLPDPTPDNRVETLFEPRNGGTAMTATMTLPDADMRRAILASDMTDGMAATYDPLDELLRGLARDLAGSP